MLVVLIEVSTWLQFVIVADLSGQMLTFDGVWHFGEMFSSRMNAGFHCTGQMAVSVYGVVWVSSLLMLTLWIEWPMWRWDYGMGRRKLWTTNTGEFYWWHFECTEIPWRGPEAHCCAIHPRPSPHVAAWYCKAPCCKDLYAIPGSWKHPSSCMASILTGHVTNWACLGCSGSAYTIACSSSCQYPATSHRHWRGVDQHSTGNNPPPHTIQGVYTINIWSSTKFRS